MQIGKINGEVAKKITSRVDYHFRKFSEIPRGSGNEEAAAQYIVEFSEGLKDLGVTVQRQTGLHVGKKLINNVVVKKPGSIGRENDPPVAFQAHLDMVCQKTPGSAHDFTKDRIVIIEENGWYRAKDTTLGADDGIGVACIMALMESTEIEHPPLEAIFTSDEEDGMSGALAFDSELINSNRLINIDTEQEGVFFYGCAGGVFTEISVPIASIAPPEGVSYYSIVVTGLQGGHSGLMIGEKRANSNRLMARTLEALQSALAVKGGLVHLLSIAGGTARNAISRETIAFIAADRRFEDTLTQEALKLQEVFKAEYAGTEPQLELTFKPCEPDPFTPPTFINADTFKRLLTVMLAVPNDVQAMHSQIAGFVETSSNMGIVEMTGGSIKVSCFIRSCFESKKRMVADQIKYIAESAGAGFVTDADFPEWSPNPNSRLKAVLEQTYKDVFGEYAVTQSVHAGLECGYFARAFKARGADIDLISIGPTILDAHTTTERLEITSVGKIVLLLLHVLAHIDSIEIETVAACDKMTIPHEHHMNCRCMI